MSNELNKKIFILGLGAQRAGTTWIKKMLVNSGQFSSCGPKEHHVFEHYFSDERNEFIKKLRKKINMLKDNKYKTDTERKRIKHLRTQIEHISDPNTYFDHYKKSFDLKENINFVGDITPIYCSLNSNQLSYIKEGLESRGFKIKVFFILRDPYERCLSMLKKDVSRGNTRILKMFTKSNGSDYVNLNNFTINEQVIRTNYEKIIPNIKKSFNSDDIYIDFFERLHTHEFSQRLFNFLGVPLNNIDINEITNKAQEINNEKEEVESLRLEVVNYYSDTYKYVINEYGSIVSDLWSKSINYLNI